MSRSENTALRELSLEVASWCALTQAIVDDRIRIERSAEEADSLLRSRLLSFGLGDSLWRAVHLLSSDKELLTSLARQVSLPMIGGKNAELVDALRQHVAEACRDVHASTGIRRLFMSRAVKERGAQAADFIREYHSWGVATSLPELLNSLDHRTIPCPELELTSALDDMVGLRDRFSHLGDAQLWPGSMLHELSQSSRDIAGALSAEDLLRNSAIEGGEAVRAAETNRLVREMPIERLKDATRDRLRIGALIEVGITTVLGVIANEASLTLLPGVGPTYARSMVGAAYTLWQATHDEMPIRLDLTRRTDEASTLIRRLIAWDLVRSLSKAKTTVESSNSLAPLTSLLPAEAEFTVVISAGPSHTVLESAISEVNVLAGEARRFLKPASFDPWEAFLERPADFFRMLQELGFNAEDEEKSHGELPEEVVEAIRAFELDTRSLTESLRGYQHFGARFALVQKKVLIGDEMGLGKTFEALAVLGHLARKGSKHSLVVCPAAVVTNWIREIQLKTDLPAHRLHGADRINALRAWIRTGGVAVTTYETLGWFASHVRDVDIVCGVFDEAHYIKNPWSQRSIRSRLLIERLDRAILLTGTPLENKVDEFRNLITYLRPDLVVDASELLPRRFKQQVAPAYLRRNQEDVLKELPELVEVDEWLEMSATDEAAYRDAVWSKNFQEMRQSAMLQGEGSAKVQRLIEIVEEAKENGRKVLVFSHYRSVLEQVCEILSGEIIGPLTGAVPAAKRQDMVDQFTRSSQGAVLVAQIQAGGVGLNIQAASVVVICEPQLKPTIEWQAIARAHRMGQPQSVQVHRLLTDPGVDLRVTQILARKKELFVDFARASDTAESAPEAFDVSEAELVREVVSAERQRLFPGAAASD